MSPHKPSNPALGIHGAKNKIAAYQKAIVQALASGPKNKTQLTQACGISNAAFTKSKNKRFFAYKALQRLEHKGIIKVEHKYGGQISLVNGAAPASKTTGFLKPNIIRALEEYENSILKFLKMKPLSASALAQKFGLSSKSALPSTRSYLGRAMQRLEQQGKIIKVGGGRSTKWRINHPTTPTQPSVKSVMPPANTLKQSHLMPQKASCDLETAFELFMKVVKVEAAKAVQPPKYDSYLKAACAAYIEYIKKLQGQLNEKKLQKEQSLVSKFFNFRSV